ncbi:MAG TPA: MMPL family transporter [Stellaceae bacterium]|nr:MMPL family transporter [Stellaceae bacterium]
MGEASGLAAVAVLLKAPPDSAEAHETVKRLRRQLAALPGADALVGGAAAIDVDIAQAAAADRHLVMPLVLVVVLAVLGTVMRAIVLPLLLIATVILSYAAALGISALAFDWGLGFAGIDQSVPLDAFIFLVALGTDYNIFLMSRARQETRHMV